jgi:RHS repeat-associated protein
MSINDRKYDQINGVYRYGFNGKEKDNDINGVNVDYDYGFRIYDTRMGKFLSLDPLAKKFPWNSPYSYAEGDPINYIDLDGGEKPPEKSQALIGYVGQLQVPLKPAATVKSHTPSMTEAWSKSKNMFAELTFNIADGIFTFGQQLTRGVTGQEYIHSIGGNNYPAGGIFGEKQRTRNFVNFLSVVIPSGGADARVTGLFSKGVDELALSFEQKMAEQAAEQTMASVQDKVTRYLLNPDHLTGGTKANWFNKALGFNLSNKNDLVKQVVFDINKAVETGTTEFGTQYNQTISIKGANGKTIDVVFGFLKSKKDDVVRLVTAIPTKK